MSANEAAAGDELAAAVPANLGADAWWRWRRANPPGHLRPENRKGSHCGICGGPLGTITKLCYDCWKADR